METFKIGDEARITANDGAHYFDVGDVGKVEAVWKDIGYWVGVDGKKFKQIVRADQMIHIIKPVLATPAPPAAPAVTSRAVVLTVEGVEYTAMFTLVNDRTGCALYWRKDNHEYALAGGTKRNPRDTYSEAVGMRFAMKRACGIGNPFTHQLPAVYRAFRKWQHDQQTNQVKPLAVGVEVVAVKDSAEGTNGPLFRKGACGAIIQIEKESDDDRTPYLVHWTGGDYKSRTSVTPANSWWASADEIEAV